MISDADPNSPAPDPCVIAAGNLETISFLFLDPILAGLPTLDSGITYCKICYQGFSNHASLFSDLGDG
jgi:hypothetical protein